MEEIKRFIRTRQPVNLCIVGINILVFLVLNFLGDTENAVFMVEHGAAYTPYILENGEVYRIVTCMFLHFGMQHLFYNMFLLIFIGDTLEKEVGKIKYLIIYLIGGVVGNLASVLMDTITGDYAVSAGASGAIFAVVGALIWIVIRNKGRLNDYSIKRLLLMAGLSVADGFVNPGIDNMAHVGGLLGGFLLAVLLYRKHKRSFGQI